ncbi:MAG: IS630 family transposase [Campylobacter sp.]|nr:IS630 family transposase [Campylobacter sp.]
MARPSKKIEFTTEERSKIENLLKNRTQPAYLYNRLNIVLQRMDNKSLVEIAKLNNTTPSTVAIWRNRYIEHGIEGLQNKPRQGRPKQYGKQFQDDILRKLEESPPEAYGSWDGVLLAEVTGYSKHAIWRFLAKQRISLARKRSWCVSTDPHFAAKAADIVGLYLSPSDNAIVICIDEKPNIQALERRTGFAVSSDDHLIQGYESSYKRHGTLNLFAALEVATGYVHAKVTDPSEKTKVGFLSFLEDVLASFDESESREFHIIMDNHSINKRHEQWLVLHNNVFFHYTPTSASWLNMVEIWFGILTIKSLRNASFDGTEALSKHIKAFHSNYNKSPQPFIWKKREIKGTQLSNSVKNFCN